MIKVGLILVIVFATTLSAQIPGTWKLHPPVCTGCAAPAAFDVNNTRAVVLLASDSVSFYHDEHYWKTYRTSDWTSGWQLAVDTVTNLLTDPFHTRYSDNQLHYYSNGTLSVISGAIHVYSKDMGDTWTVGYRSKAPGVAIYTNDPSTIFKLSASMQLEVYDFIEASSDSGFEYFKVQDVILNGSEGLSRGCFASASDIWAGISIWPDTTKAGFVWHTEDGGGSWEKSYPFDSVDAAWVRSPFGIHGYIPGANKGTLYTLGNLYHIGRPDFRMIDILHTTDNGRSWHGDSTNVDTLQRADASWGFATMNLHNPSGTQLWSVFWNKHTIAYSPNNGKDWYHDSVTFKDEDIYLMRWKDSVHGYVVTYADSTVRFYEYVLPAGVESHQGASPLIRIGSTMLDGNFVTLRSETYFEGQVEIADILGREMMTQDVILNPSGPLHVDVSRLTSGVYLLTIRTTDAATTFRIIKQ